MKHFFPRPKPRGGPWISLVCGTLFAFVVFLLIPLTQMFEPEPKRAQPIQSVDRVMPPPPPTPPEPPRPSEAEEPEAPPELETEPPRPSLEQLDIALNPGTGGAGNIRLDDSFDFETESVGELRELFEFGELDEVPRTTRQGRFVYPSRLRNRGVEGHVTLEVMIDRNGRVEVRRVLDYSHRAFVDPAVKGAEATRFTPPVRNGERVRAKYRWPIRFNLDR